MTKRQNTLAWASQSALAFGCAMFNMEMKRIGVGCLFLAGGIFMFLVTIDHSINGGKEDPNKK